VSLKAKMMVHQMIRLKKTEKKESASPDAASPGMPPELNPNFV